MINECVYIICYDQKANLGFSQGVKLIKTFPFVEGKGKSHRHIGIMSSQLINTQLIKQLILAAFDLK
jgi:hypothetical protein